MARTAADIDYQTRAKEFSVNDVVVPAGMLDTQSGRVVAVWPAIGMVSVEMLGGIFQYPAEELQLQSRNTSVIPPGGVDDPGLQSLEVTSGIPVEAPSAKRVAMYWADRDRKYKMTKAEHECGKPSCPRCKDAPALKRCVFRRTEGQSERLLGCPQCMFLIHDTDIVNFTPAEAAALDEAEILKTASGFIETISDDILKIDLGSMKTTIEGVVTFGGKWAVKLFVGNRLVRYADVKDEYRAREVMIQLCEYLQGRGGFTWPS